MMMMRRMKIATAAIMRGRERDALGANGFCVDRTKDKLLFRHQGWFIQVHCRLQGVRACSEQYRFL